MELSEFLLQRVAEDEAVARMCPPWPWRVATIQDEADAHDEQTFAGETVVAADGVAVAAPYALSGPQTRAVRDHIVRWDPARVLAECEAKRAVIEKLSATGWLGRHEILRLFALPYRDHSQFQSEWEA